MGLQEQSTGDDSYNTSATQQRPPPEQAATHTMPPSRGDPHHNAAQQLSYPFRKTYTMPKRLPSNKNHHNLLMSPFREIGEDSSSGAAADSNALRESSQSKQR